MQDQSSDITSDEIRLNQKEEASSTAHLEKLNSCWFVVFKYWMLLGALWGIKNIFSSSSPDHNLDIKVEYSAFDEVRHFINGYPTKIWDIINCALVFEGLRRKNLNIILKAIISMKAYMLVHAIITFFNLTSEAGLASAKALFQERFPEFKVDTGFLTFFSVVIVLVWGLFYYFSHIYASQKARDILKEPPKVYRGL